MSNTASIYIYIERERESSGAEGSHKHQALHGHLLSPCRGRKGEYWKRHMR